MGARPQQLVTLAMWAILLAVVALMNLSITYPAAPRPNEGCFAFVGKRARTRAKPGRDVAGNTGRPLRKPLPQHRFHAGIALARLAQGFR